MRKIIDAEGAVIGRLSSYAAKNALRGNEIIIVNSEKAVITGNKKNIIERYKNLIKKGGHSLKGPKISKIPFKLLKRIIRGMLPDFRKGIGKEAFKKIRCYNGVPKEFENTEKIKIESRNPVKFITLGELSERL
ncbi:50S ribosomal protein L13 [Candidatus Pacearchaeota archaeon]|nr:50S ribosomal protein L13 [Candidatus Pacearchaeota archaeon]MBD3283423.1 50S ribosomal protein L13 [Candidatus Pacearchaeota archaeon]